MLEPRKSWERGPVACGLPLMMLIAAVATACEPALATGPAAGPERDHAAPALAGVRLFVEDDSPARRQMEAWSQDRPDNAAFIARIADESQAVWLGDWNRDVRAAVRDVMAASTAAGTLPVLVAYNIPQRDCGRYSAGGARDGPAYLSWIREFARGLAGDRAIVVLEPDAAATIDCLTPAAAGERLDLLRQAVAELKAEGAYVYLDAGHAFWKRAYEMAPILRSAGIDRADGFALNVSNYHSSSDNIAYGRALSGLLDGARFIIDTSRNGLATASPSEWCNAAGQALGERPRVLPGPDLVDAYLWIKRPGESDGSCNGGPTAGQWWADYALGLAQRQPVSLAAGS